MPLNTGSEVFEIADLSTLWVEISLYPRDGISLQSGSPVQIIDTSGRTAIASLQYIGSTIDPETRRVKAIAEIDNQSGEWQPGTFVKAIITTKKIPVDLAITQAVQKIDGEPCCFIATDEGFEIRPIQIGRSDDMYVEVIEGIISGERYAATHSFLLKADHEKDEAEHMH